MGERVYERDEKGRIVKILLSPDERRIGVDKRHTGICFRSEIEEYQEATGCTFDQALKALWFIQRIERK